MTKDELMTAAYDTIIQADENRAMDLILKSIDLKIPLIEVLRSGFELGNKEVGERFEKGEISLPELIFSTEVMKKVTEEMEKHTEITLEEPKGRLLIATVCGDVHDIGKGIIASTMMTQGIEVIDLGRDIPVDMIIAKAEEYKVDIIATSALLTTTLMEQKKLEDALRKRGIRGKYKTMVGGAPCTGRWAKKIGADAYTEDAAEAVRKALELLKKK